VPAVDRDLTGDNNRAGIIAILDDLSVSGPQSSSMSSLAREIVRSSLA
jgi:hypothetical protein